MPKDAQIYKYEIPLDGKLITSAPPAKIGANFQELENMRYTNTGIKGIGGMTGITTSNFNSTCTIVRNAYQFCKCMPEGAQSYVFVEASSTDSSQSEIYMSTVAPPSVGNFNSTAVYTPNSSQSTAYYGSWSEAPDGDVVYCNGEENLIYGGKEHEIAGFINYDPDGSFSYDYTVQMRNNGTATKDLATLYRVSASIDSDTKLVMHCDNSSSNAVSGGQDFTANNITYDASDYKFASHSAVFNGSNAYFNLSDHADFDLSGGNFTIDAWIKLDSTGGTEPIYYQESAVNTYMKWYVSTDGTQKLSILDTGTEQLDSAAGFNGSFQCSTGVWYHLELDHSGNDWYMFVDGNLDAVLSDAAEPADYTGDIQIGYDDSAYFGGKMDEIRVVKGTTKHTSNFDVPTVEYSASATNTFFYVGSTHPLDGFKIYVQTANTNTQDSAMTVYYWSGTGWTAVGNLVDGTETGSGASSVSLGQTGTVTFDSTASVAKVKDVEGVFVYWYKVEVQGCDDQVVLRHVTSSMPMQELKDTWDGTPALIDVFLKDLKDATLQVRENEYDNTNEGTYIDISTFANTDYLYCGFSESMRAIQFNMVSGSENSKSGTIMSVDYWSGSTWTSVGTINDKTIGDGAALGKSGTVSWNPPASGEIARELEARGIIPTRELPKIYDAEAKIRNVNIFRQKVNSNLQLYYYRINLSRLSSTDVKIFHITGIPNQTELGHYRYPMMAGDRLWLLGEMDHARNLAVCSALGTSSVFNGEDSYQFRIGNMQTVVGGAWLHTVVGSSVLSMLMFFKKRSVWALIGRNPEEWVENSQRLISPHLGCVAPHTIKVVDLPATQQSPARQAVLWQARDGIYMSFGSSPIKVSMDIDNLFDERASGSINTTNAHRSWAVYDVTNHCYHWHFCASADDTVFTEYAYDLEKQAWFKITRTANALQYATEVSLNTTGRWFVYGFKDGAAYRLESGNDFNATGISQTFHTGDIAPHNGSVASVTKPSHICCITEGATSSTKVTLNHYADGKTTASSTWAESSTKAGHDLTFPVEHGQFKEGIFHSVKANLTTTSEPDGFEPLYLSMLYNVERDHTRDYK